MLYQCAWYFCVTTITFAYWQQTQNAKPLLVLLESIQRICNNTLEDFANELIIKFDVVWTSDFCSCNVGLVGMRGPHCRSRTCSHMLHQVTIVFPSSVKTGRSPSSSTPTIVAFVPPGMTSRHDDTTCKKLQAPNPIHVLHETLGNHKFRHLHVPGRARAYVSHTLLWD